jgi:hypothetical protein
LDGLERVRFRITDLPDGYLGLARPGTIDLDPDADGYGWYLDASAHGSLAFGGAGSDGARLAEPSSPAWGRMDLLTVVAHELGHELGLDDDSSNGLMAEFLPSGTRRLPAFIAPMPALAALAVDRVLGNVVADPPTADSNDPGTPSGPVIVAVADFMDQGVSADQQDTRLKKRPIGNRIRIDRILSGLFE